MWFILFSHFKEDMTKSQSLTITQTCLSQLPSWDLKIGLSDVKTFFLPIVHYWSEKFMPISSDNMSEGIFFKENIPSFIELYYYIKIDWE